MKQQLLKLDWDSDFFHFNVCRIEGPIDNYDDARAIAFMMEAGKFKLGYYASPKELFLAPTDTLEIKLVDKKTKYVKEVGSTVQYYPSISSYEYDYANGILLGLAIQSGIYSRFNIDSNIGQAKFEELYKLWVTKLVSKELAKEVFVGSAACPRAASAAGLEPSGFSLAESLISGRPSAPADLPGT